MNMADSLNLGCLCSTLQPQLLQGLAGTLEASHPHLFSASPVFMSSRDLQAMERSVSALHRVSELAGYQALALDRAPAIASHAFGPQGVFMGYDFHLGEDGPRLIEINTNAGGALLHAAAARAHRACCEPLDPMFGGATDLGQLDQVFLDMFRAEWRAQRGDAVLRTVVITDDAPGLQYLAPEFEMARQLFLAHGIHALIADPLELQWRNGALWHPTLPPGTPVDLVYNRLTDFDLSQPGHALLRLAYTAGATVVTPHPRAHALHADKRNLVALSDDALMASCGASIEDRELLRQVVPHTQPVTAENADALWAQRRQLFFKPDGGYGSKAAYRGEKLTRRVWGEITAGGFVAQALVAPSERMVRVGSEAARLKLDVRAYAYRGRIQLLAARTYSGQTTNFRTAGGGFAPVVVLPSSTDQIIYC
ncbi:hypothetical protein [Caenimonas soli]|uniref:hypothetical protein n=1 Tax=Caenimonas soli TaxID=2735555 RepID=UPI0015554801|nr:hypothetical protein [Caenimonas soli]NPC54456.1 hypothetical protein [Caenimonas soli]